MRRLLMEDIGASSVLETAAVMPSPYLRVDDPGRYWSIVPFGAVDKRKRPATPP